MKALELTSGIKRAPIQFGRQRIGLLLWCMITCPSIRHVILSQYHAQKHVLKRDSLKNIPIDSDSPFFLSEEEIVKIFNLIQPGWFAMGHLPYSESLAQIIEQEQIKMILILRDPRDVIVSHANYLAQKTSHYMYPLYKDLSKKERIMTSITGVPAGPHHPRLLSIRDRFGETVSWINHADTYTTYFEKLIGPEGNGSRDIQIAELRAIIEYIDVSVTDSELLSIAKGMYGGTRTFRKGASGRWRSDFDEDHRQACKNLVGDLLIKLGYEKDFDW